MCVANISKSFRGDRATAHASSNDDDDLATEIPKMPFLAHARSLPYTIIANTCYINHQLKSVFYLTTCQQQMCSRILAISVALILVLVPLINTLPAHSLAKRSTFFDLNCLGTYNASIFYRLDRICEDCYSLFREPEIHHNCKWVSFGRATQHLHASRVIAHGAMFDARSRYTNTNCSVEFTLSPRVRVRCRTQRHACIF